MWVYIWKRYLKFKVVLRIRSAAMFTYRSAELFIFIDLLKWSLINLLTCSRIRICMILIFRWLLFSLFTAFSLYFLTVLTRSRLFGYCTPFNQHFPPFHCPSWQCASFNEHFPPFHCPSWQCASFNENFPPFHCPSWQCASFWRDSAFFRISTYARLFLRHWNRWHPPGHWLYWHMGYQRLVFIMIEPCSGVACGNVSHMFLGGWQCVYRRRAFFGSDEVRARFYGKVWTSIQFSYQMRDILFSYVCKAWM